MMSAKVQTHKLYLTERIGVRGTLFVARVLLGSVAAGLSYYLWHEYMGGPFMFFEITEPPAADPHRDIHIRNAWISIYLFCGAIIGIFNGMRNKTMVALAGTILTSFLFVVMRSYNMGYAFMYTEEGRYGIPAILVASMAGATIASRYRMSSRKPSGLSFRS